MIINVKSVRVSKEEVVVSLKAYSGICLEGMNETTKTLFRIAGN
jgi:hypothetical protein